MSGTAPLRILFLHGYTQNGTIFRRRTGALRKSLQGVADIVCVTAPNVVPAESAPVAAEGVTATDEGPRAWFFAKPAKDEGLYIYEKWSTTLDFFANVFRESGPFDGVLGFSQGATTAAILTALLARPPVHQPPCFQINPSPSSASASPPSPIHPPFKFSVIVSGFMPRDRILAGILNEEFADRDSAPVATRVTTARTRCLFVAGAGDTLITPEKTKELAASNYFRRLDETRHEDASVSASAVGSSGHENSFADGPPWVRWLHHEGGHVVPSDAANRRFLVDFIKENLDESSKVPSASL